MNPPTGAPVARRDTAIYQRAAVLAHVLFLVAFLVTFALVGGFSPTVLALGLGAAVFAVWAVYLLRVEAEARQHADQLAQRERRSQLDRTFADERPAGPLSVVPNAGTAGLTVVAAPPPPANPVRPPDPPTGG